MSEEFQSLSGYWNGVYRYPDRSASVRFNAVLEERAGALSGECVEPNTFADPSVSELFASIAGWRDGAQVSFAKQYEDVPGAGYALQYDGLADGGLTRIEGRWRFVGGIPWSGPFVMIRRLERSEAAPAGAVEAEA